MATNKETREIEIILNGQKVNASLKEMTSAAGVMNSQLRHMSADDPGRAKLIKDLQAQKDRIAAMRQELYGVEKASLAAKLGLNDMGSIMNTVLGVAGGSLLAGGVEGVLTGVIGWFGTASDAAKDFEKSIANLASITELDLDSSDLEYYREQAALIGETTTLSAGQAVEAFQLIGGAKAELLQNKEALVGVTEQAIILAEAAGIDLPDAAQAMIGAINQFQLPVEEAGRLINVLAAGSTAGAAEIPQIAESIDKFGVAAASFNVTFEESVGLVETLAEYNLKGAESGTALRNVLGKMASVKALPASALEELDRFGVNLDVVSDTTIPLNERLTEFSKISGDATALTKVFGLENKVAGEIILTNVDKFTDLTKAVTGTSTALEQQAKNTDNLDGDLKSLSSVTESYALVIGGKLNVAKRATVQLTIALLLGLKELPKWIKENKDVMLLLGAAILAGNAHLIKANALILYNQTVTKGKLVWDRAMLIATNSQTAATTLLNAAWAANPIGIVVMAVMALGAGFMMLYNRSEAVRGGVWGMWEAFKEFLSIAGDIAMVLINPIKNAHRIKEIMNAGDRLGKAFSDGYNERLASEKQEQEKKEEAEHVQAKQKATQKGQDLGKATADGFAASLKGKTIAQLEAMLETETDAAHKKLIQKQIKHLKEVEKNQKKHQEKLKKAREEYDAAVAKSDLENAKLKIELMEEGVDKVLAKLRFQHQQELKEIEGQRNKVIANVAITEEERNKLLDLYAEEKRMKEEQLKVAEEGAKAAQKEKDKEEFYTQLEEEEEYQALALEEQFVRAFDAEFQREQALLELKRQTLEQKLAYLKEAGLGETAEALRIGNELVKIEKEVAQNKIEQAEKVAKAKKGFEDIITNGAIDTFRTTVDLLEKEKHARGIAIAAFKTFSLGKIAIDAIEEIQAIWKTAHQNPLNALIPGAGTAIAVVKTAAALARSTAAAKSIHAQQFAGGGMTKGGKTIPMVEVGGMWQMASGYSGGSIGEFAEGGWVNDAQLGLIGERGRELVIPNWMVESPKYANLVGYLEAERQKGVKAFAVGGMTTDAGPVLPAGSSDDRLVEKFDALLQKVDDLNSKVEAWPTRLQVHNNVGDTRDKLQVLQDLESKAFV